MLLNVVIFGAALLLGAGYCFFGKKYAKFLLGATLFLGCGGAAFLMPSQSWIQMAVMLCTGLILFTCALFSDGIVKFLIGMMATYQVVSLFYQPEFVLGSFQLMDGLLALLCLMAGAGAVWEKNLMPVFTGIIGAKSLAVLAVYAGSNGMQLLHSICNGADLFALQQQMVQHAQQNFWLTLSVAGVLAVSGIFIQSRMEGSCAE